MYKRQLLGDLAQLCQTEHLKSAAVGQDRPVPAGKLAGAVKKTYTYTYEDIHWKDKLTSYTVSYTHLDVYKRQIR